MKIGPRKPSLKRSVKAKTTGKIKRQAKRSIDPTYGKKGVGWVKNPKKATYNKIYNKTSYSVMPNTRKIKSSSQKRTDSNFRKLNKYGTTPSDTFYTITEKKIHRKKRSYWWVLLALLFINSGVLSAIFIGMVIAGFIYYHNQKPSEERVQVKHYLSDEKKEELIKRIEDLSVSNDRLLKNINSTLKANVYFRSLSEFKSVHKEINHLNYNYHLPVSYEITVNKRDDVQNANKSNLTSILNKSTSAFIKRYYKNCEEQASKLKTEKGYLNRMNRNKETLIAYSHYLSEEHHELIEKLWNKNYFKKS